jgi:ABC-type sugar transport system ATPase subunit
MNSGEVSQVDTPWTVYKNPEKYFVASFVGSMNFVKWPRQSWLKNNPLSLKEISLSSKGVVLDPNKENIIAGVRPEDISLTSEPIDKDHQNIVMSGIIEKISFSGREAFFHILLEEEVRLLVNVSRPDELSLKEIGETINLVFPKNALMFFDEKSGSRC